VPLALAVVLGAVAFLEFANLPWVFVCLWVTRSRKARASDLLIPRTVNVTHAG